MPLIAWAVGSYATGLLAGFAPGPFVSPAIVGPSGALAVLAVLATLAALAFRLGAHTAPLACAVLFAAGVAVAQDAALHDRTPAPAALNAEDAGGLQRWRAHAGATIDTLFAADAPMVRALLIADKRGLPADVKERYAAAGLMHVLAIAGLHVAVLAGAVLLLLEAARIPRASARWLAFGVTALYVAAIGAPVPALRSASMLGIRTLTRSLDRPVSPWAVLAWGALLPLLVDPREVTAIGWQLTVAGYAAITAAGIWTRRSLPRTVRGARRTLSRHLAAATLATVVTAPLVAWAFGLVSFVAPLTNLVAAPMVVLLQPTLFLALLLAPFRTVALFVAEAAHPVLAVVDGIARAGAAVPGGSMQVAPSLAVSVTAAVASVALVVAAASRERGRPAVAAALAVTCCLWWPLAPAGSGLMELHMIDVGQGDAVAVRTPHGRWILVDAGRQWPGGDAGRKVVIPYLRRFGGDLALFVLTHPHADHVGGAATVLRALRPLAWRDAAFAGGSAPYRQSLALAAQLGIPWARVHRGESLAVDGVTVHFLAPDSAWSAHLTDPNLASTVAIVQYGAVRFLLTGDAEASEEEWLLAHERDALTADVLKVGHHGSSTSSTDAFLDAVHPRLALISVGAGNSYGHPNGEVVRRFLDRGATVLRTDQLGSIVVRTNGRTLQVVAAGHEWAPKPADR